jgi:hypothetical protein
MLIAMPKAWSQIIEDEDEMLLEIVADRVESLCGFKPDPDMVAQFLKGSLAGRRVQHRRSLARRFNLSKLSHRRTRRAANVTACQLVRQGLLTAWSVTYRRNRCRRRDRRKLGLLLIRSSRGPSSDAAGFVAAPMVSIFGPRVSLIRALRYP